MAADTATGPLLVIEVISVIRNGAVNVVGRLRSLVGRLCLGGSWFFYIKEHSIILFFDGDRLGKQKIFFRYLRM